MLAGSEARAPASSGQGLWRQRESHHRETSRALGGWPGHVLSPGDPELDMAHLHPGRSLQWKKHNPGSKGVFVLVYSIIHSRNTYRVPAAFPNHRQTWAVAPTSQASESRKGSSPPSPHDHGGGGGGGARAQVVILSPGMQLLVPAARWPEHRRPPVSRAERCGFESQLGVLAEWP